MFTTEKIDRMIAQTERGPTESAKAVYWLMKKKRFSVEGFAFLISPRRIVREIRYGGKHL